MQNNKMVSISELIKSCFSKYNVYIPLLQRNYKWSKENDKDLPSAKKLSNDLWQSYTRNENSVYTMGMITLYNESSQNLQLIDGQQRIITLTLLLKILNSEENYFDFCFERDDGVENDKIKRSVYLQNINSINVKEEHMYTDLIRFRENFEGIKEVLEENHYKESEKDGFINYILKRVHVLLHVTDVEPTDEFLNINKNKTPFVISDYIKANLIIDSGRPEYESCISRKNILHLFKMLSLYLFDNIDNDIWELVKQGYECKTDENRLKVLFYDRYNKTSTIGYECEKEYKRLDYYKRILNILIDDIKEDNWNTYNGFNCLRRLKNIKNDSEFNELRFFGIFGDKYNEVVLNHSLEEMLWNQVINSTLNHINYFIESQLYSNKIDTRIFESLPSESKEEWVYTANEEIEEFKNLYSKYIEDRSIEIVWRKTNGN